MKVVIVGGVAGGASAAARLRRLDESAEIIMIERTGYVSYANCGLPYYVGGVITEKKKLALQTPQSFKARFNIDARVRQEVIDIDRAGKTVRIRNLDDATVYEESYDKLVLSPGAHPVIPDVPGVDHERVFTLRTVEDTFAIKGFVGSEKPRSAVVVGAGFIGLEMAENLRELGMDVTIVQRGNQVMKPLDPDLASLLHNKLRAEGIGLALGARFEGVFDAANSQGGVVEVRLAEREPLLADMVVLSIGVAPESKLAREAGLELGVRDAIMVDSHLRTSDPDIYAVGDAVQVEEFVGERASLISLAGPANKQGRIAAENIVGGDKTYDATLGTSVLKLFDLTAASTGVNSDQAQRLGLSFDSVVLTPPSHATYYPGAESLVLKVLFERESGRIIGAQSVGRDGVDKRIDVIATAIRAGMHAADLAELDLAYAPPYSSAKDPVNMAGFMIENILDGLVEQVHWEDALACAIGGARAGDAVLLDTRTAAEYERGHVEGALSIPLDELRDRLDEVPVGGMLYVYCQSGLRSYVACRILTQNGFACANVAGGYGFLRHALLDGDAAGASIGACGVRV